MSICRSALARNQDWQRVRRSHDRRWSFSGITTSIVGFPNYVQLGGAAILPDGSGWLYGLHRKGWHFLTRAFCHPDTTLRPDIHSGHPLQNPAWKQNVFAATGTSTYLNSTASASTPNIIGTFQIPGNINAPAFGNAPRTLPGARSPREFLYWTCGSPRDSVSRKTIASTSPALSATFSITR